MIMSIECNADYIDIEESLGEDSVCNNPGGPTIWMELVKTKRAGIVETCDTRLHMKVRIDSSFTMQGAPWIIAFSKMMEKWLNEVNTPGTTTKENIMTFSEFASKLTSLADTSLDWNERVTNMLIKHEGRGKLLPVRIGQDVDLCSVKHPVTISELEFLIV